MIELNIAGYILFAVVWSWCTIFHICAELGYLVDKNDTSF